MSEMTDEEEFEMIEAAIERWLREHPELREELTLIQVEIARRNEASKQAQQRSRVPVDEEYPG